MHSQKQETMRKILTLIITLAFALTTYADDYNTLTFEKVNGTKTTIKSVGTVITFDGGTLTAINDAVSKTLSLDELSKMYFSASTNGLKGDVNCDGSVNVTDVMLTVNHVMGYVSEGFYFELADIDGDGYVTVVDVMSIVGIVLGN